MFRINYRNIAIFPQIFHLNANIPEAKNRERTAFNTTNTESIKYLQFKIISNITRNLKSQFLLN